MPTCVTDVAGLKAALAAAQDDGGPNYIGLVKGTYPLTEPLVVNVTDNVSLTIEGGYQNAACNAIAPTPEGTFITGGTGVYIDVHGYGALSVSNLSITSM